MTRYRLAREAAGDLQKIRDHLAGRAGPQVAGHVLGRLRSAMRLLAERPGIGHVRADLTSWPVKFWPVFSYLIVYDPARTPIAVVRVLHGAQDVQDVLRSSIVSQDTDRSSDQA